MSDDTPYADNDGSHVARWENGDYRLVITREDGESMAVNMRETQLKALSHGIDSVLEDNPEP